MPSTQGQGRGRSNSLPSAVVDYLRAWLLHPDHIHHPYPTEQEKAKMIADTGIDMKRLNNWFVNSRIRIWKPQYEDMLKKQKQGKPLPITVSPAATQWQLQQPPQSAPKEKYLQPSASKKSVTTATSPRRVSLIPPSPPVTKKVVLLHHPVSDSSDISLSSSSSSSFSGTTTPNEEEEARLSASCKRPSSVDVMVTFTTTSSPPPRPQKRPRAISEAGELPSPSSFSSSCSSNSSNTNRYDQENVQEWIQACAQSPRLDDHSLPTLDEAACLFGFSSAIA